MITSPPEGHKGHLARNSTELWGQCDCGKRFDDWGSWEADHERHVFAVIWAVGYRQGADDQYTALEVVGGCTAARTNPYEEEA